MEKIVSLPLELYTCLLCAIEKYIFSYAISFNSLSWLPLPLDAVKFPVTTTSLRVTSVPVSLQAILLGLVRFVSAESRPGIIPVY